jgi:hypothetical protein
MLNALYPNATDRRIPILCFPRFHASTGCTGATLQSRPLVLYRNESTLALAESSSKNETWLAGAGLKVVE